MREDEFSGRPAVECRRQLQRWQAAAVGAALSLTLSSLAAGEEGAGVERTPGAVSASSASISVAEMLDGIAQETSTNLRVAVEFEGAPDASVEIGQELQYQLQTESSGYCYLLHVDSRDRATVIRPEGCEDPNHVSDRGGVSFPSTGRLTADYPAGPEAVYGIFSDEIISEFEAALAGQSTVAILTVPEADQVAGKLVASAASGSLTIARQQYDVVEAEQQFTTRGIIRRVVEGQGALSVDGELAKFDLKNILFDFASDELTRDSKRQLDAFGEALQSSELDGVRLRVAGHTDDVGEAQFNDELSLRRANAVREYLLSQYRFENSRLQAVGLGEDVPLVANRDDDARALNRRVEMVFVANDAQGGGLDEEF